MRGFEGGARGAIEHRERGVDADAIELTREIEDHPLGAATVEGGDELQHMGGVRVGYIECRYAHRARDRDEARAGRRDGIDLATRGRGARELLGERGRLLQEHAAHARQPLAGRGQAAAGLGEARPPLRVVLDGAEREQPASGRAGGREARRAQGYRAAEEQPHRRGLRREERGERHLAARDGGRDAEPTEGARGARGPPRRHVGILVADDLGIEDDDVDRVVSTHEGSRGTPRSSRLASRRCR